MNFDDTKICDKCEIVHEWGEVSEVDGLDLCEKCAEARESDAQCIDRD